MYSRVLGAEAAEYAERVKVGNPLNRAQIDLLQETAEDMGAFDEGELSVQLSVSLARRYNLSGNETQVKEIARRLREIREGMQGSENAPAIFIMEQKEKSPQAKQNLRRRGAGNRI